MAATQESYEQLQKRLENLKRQHAVREAQRETAIKERDRLIAELRAAGVDTENLSQELTRLEKEIEEDYQRQAGLVAEFATKLNPPPKTQSPQQAAAPVSTPAGDTVAL